MDKYVLDGQTTYCWKINADIASTNITSDAIVMQGSGRECPLSLSLKLSKSSFEPSRFVNASCSVTMNEASTGIMNFHNLTSSASVGESTVPANIAYSDIHVCPNNVHCSPFTKNEQQNNTNQIRSLMPGITTFTTNRLTADVPGMDIVVAHIIVPGETSQYRLDFAVFTQVEVISPNKSLERTASPVATWTKSKGLSENVVFVLVGVGVFMFALLLLCALYVIRRRNKPTCMDESKLQDGTDDRRSMESQCASIYPKQNVTTHPTTNDGDYDSRNSLRSSEWAKVYTADGNMSTSILHDDINTLAILRASRVSSPSPVQSRTIADFRSSIARWDTSVSGSPISPSSSELLFKLSRDSDASSTPSSTCFISLDESFRKSRKIISIRSARNLQPDCEDSGDEEEGEI